ncbi:helix-turn-helix domain-containing protein [Nonomuraea sp. NPDC052116]|uniref:helix-turn-helix domain-containing protein n=1 Tax=Nonomuraea sp. NPDC052116 TaxID=3155665 RepID=UPI00342DE201
MARHTTPEQQSEQQQEDEQTQALAKAAAAVTRKTMFRFRHAIAPHATAFGVWGAGMALHLADVPAWQVLAGEAAAYAAAATVRALIPSTRKALSFRWWQAGAGAWLPAADALGPFGAMQSLYFAAAGLWTVPYVWRNRDYIVRPEKKRRALEAAQAKELEAADPIVIRWAQKTAGKKGALADSKLTNREEFVRGGAEGTRYRIVLDGYTTEDAMLARKRICSDFGVAINFVHVEEPDDGAQNAATVTFLKRLAVVEPELWTEPLLDLETGILPVGPFEDGWGDAALQVWEPGSGPLPVGIFGAMRTGKSSILKIAAAEFARTEGRIVLDYLDPQDGQSCPSLLPYVPHALGIDAIRQRLYAYQAEMQRRRALLSQIEWTDEDGITQRGVQSYDHPGVHGMPMLVIAIDEFHLIARHEDLATIVHDILAEGSKCGMTVWTLDQNVYVAGMGGGDILALVTSGNVVVLRVSDRRIASATFGERMTAYPHLIKIHFPGTQNKTKGCGYLLGATDRPVMMRARHIPKMSAVMRGMPAMTVKLPKVALPDDAAPVRSKGGKGRRSPAIASADVVDLDAPAQMPSLTPSDVAAAQEKVLSLLADANEGLTGAELTVRSGLPLPVAFRVAASLVEQGQARMVDGRYVEMRRAS